MSSTLQQGLSEAEIDMLAQRLASNPNPEALSLEAVDGLFCALIASPRAVMPHEYLPVILGGTLGEAGVLGELADVASPDGRTHFGTMARLSRKGLREMPQKSAAAQSELLSIHQGWWARATDVCGSRQS